MAGRKGMGRRWGDRERQWILLAWEAGADHDQIALLVGRSRDGVQSVLYGAGGYRHNSRTQPERRKQSRTYSEAARQSRRIAGIAQPRPRTIPATRTCPDCGFKMGPEGHAGCRAA